MSASPEELALDGAIYEPSRWQRTSLSDYLGLPAEVPKSRTSSTRVDAISSPDPAKP